MKSPEQQKRDEDWSMLANQVVGGETCFNKPSSPPTDAAREIRGLFINANSHVIICPSLEAINEIISRHVSDLQRECLKRADKVADLQRKNELLNAAINEFGKAHPESCGGWIEIDDVQGNVFDKTLCDCAFGKVKALTAARNGGALE